MSGAEGEGHTCPIYPRCGLKSSLVRSVAYRVYYSLAHVDDSHLWLGCGYSWWRAVRATSFTGPNLKAMLSGKELQVEGNPSCSHPAKEAWGAAGLSQGNSVDLRVLLCEAGQPFSGEAGI